MHFTDTAIVLTTRRHGEHSAIVRVLTQNHGLYAGAIRGAHSKAARGLWQPGNSVLMTWKARLPEHIGNLSGELLEANAAHLMQDAAVLAALSSATTLISMLLAEREPHTVLYHDLYRLIATLRGGADWPESYARFELNLLSECGYRLDLSACAATGITDDLTYVSPKSGRAVSRLAGEPYKEKLFRLPSSLLRHSRDLATPSAAEHMANAEHGFAKARSGNPSLIKMDPRVKPEDDKNKEILDSLRMTGYFLEKWLLTPHGKTMPAARMRLTETLTAPVHG